MGMALNKLTANEREAIARELFKVDDKTSNLPELRGLCPIHNEKNPSFSYNVEKDVYNCLACGASGDLIKLYTVVKGYSDNKTGFKAFCEQYGIENKSKQIKSHTSHRRSCKQDALTLDNVLDLLPNLPDNWIVKLTESRGWSKEIINEMDLRQQTHFQAKKSGKIINLKKPDRIAIPIKDSNGICKNIRLYKPGGDPKIISWGKAYGNTRLFPAVPKDDGVVLLCEGESDTLCALSNGFNAITQTSKPSKWRQEHLKPFKDRDVVIAYDADLAGEKYTKFSIENLKRVAKSVRVLTWPDWMGRQDDGQWPKDHGQDLTDFFVRHGKSAQDLQELIDQAMLVRDAFVGGCAMDFFIRGANDRLSFKSRLLAERILQERQLLFDTDTGLLYQWNNRFWEVYHEDHIKSLAVKLLGDEAQRSRVEDAVFQAKILSAIPHGRKVNDQQDWVCVKNGLLNLRTLELKPHNPDYYATFELNVTYNPDSKKKCNRWLQFLEETVQTQEAINQLQEFVGYCLIRETRFEKCLLLIGPGADGKSKFLKVLQQLVGEENCSAVSFHDLEDQFLRSSLYGKLLNISTEVGNKTLESPYFKAIVSGDPINAAFKHKDAFTFSPYSKLAFAANKLPRVLDNSDGYFRRLLPISFKRQFLEDSPDTDPNLEEKLLKELSEIFEWALVGLHRLWDQGRFSISYEGQDHLRSYRRLNNPVVCFVEDICIIGDDHSASKREIYKRYETYCRENGYNAFGKENFFRELYAAINGLKTSRPRKNNPGREMFVNGIAIDSYGGCQ